MIKENKTYIAIPPGETIKEQLEDRGISQKEFAARMEVSEKHISRLINGDVLLTTDMAIKLEMVLGLPASFWNNLEFIYRENLAKIDYENNLNEEANIAKNFPYSKMANLDWVPATKNVFEKVINLRKFFEVNRLGLLIEQNILSNVFYRRLTEYNDKDYAMMAWIQKAKMKARSIETKNINIKGIINNLNTFKSMSLEDPSVFCKKLTEMLAECGVAIVFLPHIGGSFLHGATFTDKNKIVLGLTVRGKDADKFWFSFFHEIGHIVLGHLDKAYDKKLEDDADKFAENSLINKENYISFVSKHDFSIGSIKKFAKEENVLVGIVIGRLQNDNIISHRIFNQYKLKYEIADKD